MSAAREYLVPLLRRHTLASLEAAWYLATPPFAVAIASLAIGAGLAVLSGSLLGAGLLLGLVSLLAFDLAIALVQTRAGVRTWLALVGALWYVPWKIVVQAGALASVRRRDAEYGPTPRV